MAERSLAACVLSAGVHAVFVCDPYADRLSLRPSRTSIASEVSPSRFCSIETCRGGVARRVGVSLMGGLEELANGVWTTTKCWRGRRQRKCFRRGNKREHFSFVRCKGPDVVSWMTGRGVHEKEQHFHGDGDLQDGQRGVHDTTEMAPTIGGERAGWMRPPRVFSATRKKAAHATVRPPASWHMRLHLIVMAAASSAALSYPQTKWDLRDSMTAALLVCRATNYLKSWPVSTGVEAVKPGNDLPFRPRLFVRTRALRWSLPSVASVLYGIVETCL